MNQPTKGAKNAAAITQGAEIVSSGASTSISRPATPNTLGRFKGRFIRSFRSSTPKSSTEQVQAPPVNSTQQAQPAQVAAVPTSLIVPVVKTPFEEAPDDRAGEIEIYNRGIKVVGFLQELAGLTGSGVPNPVPSILKALTGVLTQLQVSVSGDQMNSELTRTKSKW